MVKALDSRKKPVTLSMIEERPEPFLRPLQCAYCTRQATTASSYTRRTPSGGTTTVSAYFRLLGTGEHDETCVLFPERIVNHVAHGSHGLAHVQDDGTLHLTLPDDLGVDRSPPPPPPADEPTREGGAAHKTTTVHPWLPPALGSAVKIARLLRLAANDPAAVRMFRIRHHEKVIPWHRFCYGPEEESLLQLCSRVLTSKTNGRLPHPVAVHGTVIRTGISSTGKPFALLAARLKPDGAEQVVDVCVRSEAPGLLAPLREGMQLLAVGERWKAWHRRDGRVEVQLWANEHWRLAYWELDTEGVPGPPACPPPVRRTAAPPQALIARRKPSPLTDPTAAPPEPPSAAPSADDAARHFEPAAEGPAEGSVRSEGPAANTTAPATEAPVREAPVREKRAGPADTTIPPRPARPPVLPVSGSPQPLRLRELFAWMRRR